MLSVRITGPSEAIESVLPALRERGSVTSILHLRGAGVAVADQPHRQRDVVDFLLAREDANGVTALLQDAGLQESGSIQLSMPITVISDAADRAESVGPGDDRDDAVIWDQVADISEDNARLSMTFLAFLVLAALIAGVGRIIDQPVLIIGAMVVGPEFAPISAFAFGLAFRQFRTAGRALATLAIGFALAIGVSWAVWGSASLLGLVSHVEATSGARTAFIIQPDWWSFVIAVLAGITGVLSLTSSKSSILVGVFISITTIPAVAVIGLTLAVGAWSETLEALVQLGVNVAGLVIAGVLTLLALRLLSPRLSGAVVTLRLRTRRPGRQMI